MPASGPARFEVPAPSVRRPFAKRSPSPSPTPSPSASTSVAAAHAQPLDDSTAPSSSIG